MSDSHKEQLRQIIVLLYKERRLTQIELAHELKVSQPRVSDLINGKLDLFSVEALLDFIEALGWKVDFLKACEKVE